MLPAPSSHLQDAQKLSPDGVVNLFEISLKNGTVLYLKDGDAVTYQGMNFESIAIHVTGLGRTASEENYRPKLAIANPEGIFSLYIQAGHLDNAEVKRYRVLRDDLDANNPVYMTSTWRVAKPVSVNKDMIVLELRTALDGANFVLPGRIFSPPDFPQVSLV